MLKQPEKARDHIPSRGHAPAFAAPNCSKSSRRGAKLSVIGGEGPTTTGLAPPLARGRRRFFRFRVQAKGVSILWIATIGLIHVNGMVTFAVAAASVS
ncbi:hypothetical protein ASC90_08630 [Rhizobium sp. Root1220]|nr:hypothetical protein ASC90_08630 [Rhizobium sp. Root1220]